MSGRAGEGGVALRCAILEPDSMERSQLSDIDSGGGEQSTLEFRGIGRERRCEGHQSEEGGERGREGERAAGPFVGRSVGRSDRRSVGKGPKGGGEGGVAVSWMDQRQERERERERERENNGKRKVAAVSRFDCAMFSDSSRVD